MWDWYVTEVIVPFCSASDAAFVVDSHAAHISELTGDLYAHHSITPIQVPEGMTHRLQPNDVGVYGPLNALVSGLWLDQKREEPEKWDSFGCVNGAVPRCLGPAGPGYGEEGLGGCSAQGRRDAGRGETIAW